MTKDMVLHYNLFQLSQIAYPDLGVVDAYTSMEGNGPIEGIPLETRIALAGVDPLALDTIGTKSSWGSTRLGPYLSSMDDVDRSMSWVRNSMIAYSSSNRTKILSNRTAWANQKQMMSHQEIPIETITVQTGKDLFSMSTIPGVFTDSKYVYRTPALSSIVRNAPIAPGNRFGSFVPLPIKRSAICLLSACP